MFIVAIPAFAVVFPNFIKELRFGVALILRSKYVKVYS